MSALLKNIHLVLPLLASSRTIDYFDLTFQLHHSSNTPVPHPLRTQTSSLNVAFHLTRDTSFKRMSVDNVAEKFNLPDLRPALGDYMIWFAGKKGEPFIQIVGGQRYLHQGCKLPFAHIEVWNWVQLQSKSYHVPHDPCPACMINTFPPSPDWPLGHYDSVLINNNPSEEWPLSGLNGNSSPIFVSMKFI